MNMLIVVTTAWPLSQAARYGGLIQRKQFGELRRAFWPMCIASSLVAASAALVVLLALMWATEHNFRYVGRFADNTTTGILLATAVTHHVTHCFSVVLRAERRDPTLPFTVIGSILLVVVTWLCAHYGVPRDIALANLALTLLGVPVVIFLYWQRGTHWVTVFKVHP
jgi:hypothetical protein